jgi:choline transport protein
VNEFFDNKKSSCGPSIFIFLVVSITDDKVDYCVVVFFIILIISIVQWIVDGRKNFTGPRVNLESLQTGAVVGLDPSQDGLNNSVESSEKGK